MLVGASVVVFLIIRLIPGDPVTIMLGQQSSEAAREALRRQLGLDLPVWEQYLQWVGDVVRGDWGQSVYTGESVLQLIGERYPDSLELALLSTFLALVIAVPLGILGALDRNSGRDYAVLLFSQLGMSIPSFLLAILLIVLFANHLGWFPTSGSVALFESFVGNLRHVVLPTVSLGLINAAVFTRYLRSSMLDELNKDYVRTARAFGHPRRRVLWKYVLRNALIPLVTITGLQFGFAIGGVVIIEQVFGYAGMGRLILNALLNRNYPLVQLALLVFAATFIVANLLVDLVYGLLDPRIRY
jgi:peptide/nickel transport system permease protein